MLSDKLIEVSYTQSIKEYKKLLNNITKLFNKKLNIFKFINDNYYPQIYHFSKNDKRGILYNKITNDIEIDNSLIEKHKIKNKEYFLFLISSICKEANTITPYLISFLKEDDKKYYIAITMNYKQYCLKDLIGNKYDSVLKINKNQFIQEKNEYIDRIIYYINDHELGKFFKVKYKNSKELESETSNKINKKKIYEFRYNNKIETISTYKNKITKRNNLRLKISQPIDEKVFKRFFYNIENKNYLRYFAFINLLYYLEEKLLKETNLSLIYFNNLDETFNLYLTLKPYCLLN